MKFSKKKIKFGPLWTSERLGEMFEGESADTCARKFPLMLMGGRANGPACADGQTVSEDPHRRERKFPKLIPCFYLKVKDASSGGKWVWLSCHAVV